MFETFNDVIDDAGVADDDVIVLLVDAVCNVAVELLKILLKQPFGFCFSFSGITMRLG